MNSNNTNQVVNSDVTINCVEEAQNHNDEEPSANLVVSILEDENDGDFSEGDLSLREAIANSRDGDTIVFESSLSQGAIVLTEGALTVDKSISIYGLGVDNLTIDGNNSDRVLNVTDDQDDSFLDVNISDLTITGGQNTFTFPPNDPNFAVAFGGGIRNQENLNLNKVSISDNSSGNLGGGIYNDAGVLSLNNSQVVNNRTHIKGGGVYNNSGTVNITTSTVDSNRTTGERRQGAIGGGIFNREGTLTLDSSTVSNNRANSAHGGIDNGGTLVLTNITVSGNDGAMGSGGIKNSNVAQIINSTIANNSGAGADGIVSFPEANLELTSSIVVGSTNSKVLLGDTLTSLGGNLIANGDGVEIINRTDAPDLVGTTDSPIAPQLGELQNNGGATQTHALLENSPAIDAGSNPNNLATDQRGTGFNRTVGNATDIGAYEIQNNGGEQMNQELIVSTTEDENDGDFGEGDLSLREAIALANEREGKDLITFDDSLNGSTISLTETQTAPRPGTINQDLLITDSVQIDGLGANNLTIDGVNGGGGIFRIEGADTDVTVTNLNIVNGDRQQFFFQNPTFGGAILVNDSDASLTLQNSVISGSSASYAGAISSNGDVNIFGSLIENNASGSSGEFQAGAIRVSSSGNLSILNSTVANNSDRGITSAGLTEISNSTIVDGIQGNDVTLTSSIVLNDSDSSVASIEGNPIITSGGHNLIGNGNSLNGFVDSDLVGTADNPIDPQLGELQDNGGLTKTLALQESSPAIDLGSNPSNLTFDQRGLGFSRTSGNATDIGAYEVQDSSNGEIPDELVVSTSEDEEDGDFSAGDLSLREAIALANEREGADTITFDEALLGSTINLTATESDPRGLGTINQDLLLTDSLTIKGLGADNLTIDGVDGGGGIFKIEGENTQVALEDLTITNGRRQRFFTQNPTLGGAIWVSDREALLTLSEALLTLSNSVVSNSSASSAGAIFVSGSAEIVNSSIVNNQSGGAEFPGGAIGIPSQGEVKIINSTVANNSGRGIANRGNLEILNSTISDGIDTFGSDDIDATFPDSMTTITSSIVVDDVNTEASSIGGNQTIVSGGNNLIANGEGVSGVSDSDLIGTADNPLSPELGELQNNGGRTLTQALNENSPAINAGSNPNNLATDQRGEGFERTVGSTDIGAFEVQNGGSGETPTELIVSTTEDEDDGDYSAGDLSLREAIALANEREGADTISFNDSLNGNEIALNDSLGRDFELNDELSINGLGRDNLTLDGGFIFKVAANTDVTLDGLDLKGGTVDNLGNLTFSNSTIREISDLVGTSGDRAIISRGGNANIINSSIKDNAGSDSVGVVIESGTATVLGSTIANNSGGTSGPAGIVIEPDGIVEIANSTIANNSSRSGGGVVNAGTVEISNSTIANNQGGRTAGGIINRGEANISSSIVAKNIGNDGTFSVGDVLTIDDGVFVSGGNNLIGNGDDATGFINGVNGDLVGSDGEDPLAPQPELLIDPQLGDLQNNGGLTETLALQDGSPALDAGSNPNNLATDQRGEGFDRTVGNGTDIGAYEVQDNGDGQMNEELVVSTLEDENDGDFSDGDLSLREAIVLANEREGADTITFDASLNGSAIALNSALEREIVIYDSVAINGLGQDNLTLDGSFIFNVEAHADATFEGLNLVGGKIDSSGNLNFSNSSISQTAGIGSADNSAIISRGNATIVNSSIKDNDGGGNVGIVFESGTGTIERSAITDNDSSDYAQSGVIIRDSATVDISNSTIANNIARSNAGIENSGTANIFNSTIANNSGGLGSGGVKSLDGGTTTVTSSILANNTGNSGGALPIGDISISGTGQFVSGGNNLIGNGDDATGFVNGENGDLVGSNGNEPFAPQTELLIDPRLGDLQNNGGSTETLALLENSPALDAGSNPNNLTTDQRGVGFDRTVGNGTDIGAYEVQDSGVVIPTELVVSTLEDEADGDYSQGDLSLREAIALANDNQTITFDSGLSDGSIVLSQGSLLIDKSLNINGLGANNLTVDGNKSFRLFLVDDGDDNSQADVSISGLTLKDGSSLDSDISYLDGGGFLNRENLTVNNSALIGNRAGNGGAIFNTGSLQFTNSVVIESDGTGPINNDGGAVSIINSTFTNNGVAGVSAIVNNNGGTLELANSTITNNSGYGAALFNSEDSTATVASTIVANNLAELPEEEGKDDILGDYISQGNNLIGTTKGGSGFDSESDLVGTEDNPIDPKLGILQDNGGLTQTIALLEDSPAIDAGSNPNSLITDQRGEGFDRTVGNGTDIGAFEVQTISNEDIIGTEGRDFLQGTNESDRIFGLDGTDFIQGLDGDDLIDGGSGGDRLLGGAGDDTITDGSGNDIVFGNEGDDIFIASNAGDDLFSGGAGKDIYVYDLNANADGFERARIIDFEPEQDLIAFRPLVSDMATLAEFADLDTDGSGVLDSEDERINIRGVSTTIDFSDLFGHDANSDTITLIGATSLNESNFLFNETVVGTEFG